MSNSTISTITPAMVPADQIVYTGLSTVSKVVGAGAIAKATGKKSGYVTAKHYSDQGAALALASSVTGKGKTHAIAIQAEAQLNKIVNEHGVIDNYTAVTTVASVLRESLTFEESIRADGQRVVKRAYWLSLGETLETVAADPATPKAKAARYADALTLYRTIQAHADSRREIKSLTA